MCETKLSVDNALASVLVPGQTVVLGQGHGTPRALAEALPRHLDRLAGSRLLVGMVDDDFPVLPGVEVETFFPSGALGSVEGLHAHSARYLRVPLYDLAHGLRHGGCPVDVALVQATEPRRGRLSLGPNLDFALPAAQSAGLVVAEIMPDLPWTGPHSTIALRDGVTLVASSRRTPTIAPGAPTGIAGRIAEQVVRWIPDGASLEFGMGRTLDGVPSLLRAKRGLRIHSGLIGDWLADLHDAGALARSHSPLATAAIGSAAFYSWLSGDSGVVLTGADVSHDPARLAALPRLHAINSVLEVDLQGRANSERGFGGRLGGIGGLRDFAQAAAAASDGLSIIALPAATGECSRIVVELPADARTLDASAVDVVVTEYGSADLRGLSGRERADAVICIAAPEHREALRAAAGNRTSTLTREESA